MKRVAAPSAHSQRECIVMLAGCTLWRSWQLATSKGGELYFCLSENRVAENLMAHGRSINVYTKNCHVLALLDKPMSAKFPNRLSHTDCQQANVPSIVAQQYDTCQVASQERPNKIVCLGVWNHLMPLTIVKPGVARWQPSPKIFSGGPHSNSQQIIDHQQPHQQPTIQK